MKKIPMRKCVVSNQSFPKAELLRIVKTPNGEIKVDLTGKLNGKGAYIKKEISVLNALKNKKILKRIFELDIDEAIYTEIAKNIHE